MASKTKTAKPRGRQRLKPPAVTRTAEPPIEPKPEGNAGGRPTKYTQAIADGFCDLIADSKTAKEALRIMGDPVDWSTVKRWLRENEEFRAQYARAREDQGDTDADTMRDIMRLATPGAQLQEGEGAITPDVARVLMDGHKWLAGKRKPKAYGSDLELSDDDGTVTVQIVRFSKTAKVDK